MRPAWVHSNFQTGNGFLVNKILFLKNKTAPELGMQLHAGCWSSALRSLGSRRQQTEEGNKEHMCHAYNEVMLREKLPAIRLVSKKNQTTKW